MFNINFVRALDPFCLQKHHFLSTHGDILNAYGLKVTMQGMFCYTCKEEFYVLNIEDIRDMWGEYIKYFEKKSFAAIQECTLKILEDRLELCIFSGEGFTKRCGLLTGYIQNAICSLLEVGV